MKKTFIALIALALVAAIVWGWVRSQQLSPYALAPVSEEIRRLASSASVPVIDERKISGALRGSKVSAFDRWIQKLSGKPLYNDLNEYRLKDGTGVVLVSVYHSIGKVGLVEIRPSPPPSRSAASLQTGLTAAFPKLDCRLEAP
ncbi:hypothetical protein OKA05_28365 [Luteolibacter arcticus]|uniref:Uncharacterized protein n=1 Tax=Luteolibacter arcticus TaxID=1581411 RepID=A0ABT3GSQ9_9BACT|nr:hypothetical protein [Luteolibacter arcticus]MCW1926499.1 hypothetical protein [Luteolibacter arcticus]